MNTATAGLMGGRFTGDLDGEPLTLALRAELEALLAPLADGLSEYSFTKLYLWRGLHGYRLQRGELPCIAGYTLDGKRHLLPLFDTTAVDAEELAGRLAGYDCYFPLSERRVAVLDRGRFVVDALPADADYVYPIVNFMQYEGDEMDDKRSAIRELLRHGQPVAVPFGRSSVGSALAVLDAARIDGDVRSEATYGPAVEAIEQAGELGLQGHIYFLDDEPIGFVLGEMLTEQMMLLHVAKVRLELPGVQPMMFHHMATVMNDRVRWFNFEQDLGHADFRQQKQGYQPTSLLPKYRLRLAAA